MPLQAFVLGGDAVRALALNASPDLQEAIAHAFCEDQLSGCDGGLSDSSVLEEAHLSVLVADLDPQYTQRQHEFLASRHPSCNVLLSQPQASSQHMPAASRKELLHAVMHTVSLLPLHLRLLGRHNCFLRCEEESAPGACGEGALHSSSCMNRALSAGSHLPGWHSGVQHASHPRLEQPHTSD